jgi:hypothetical protein
LHYELKNDTKNIWRMLKSQNRVGLIIKFKKMKKSTLITGYVAAFILFIGMLFKLQHYPGAGIMIVIGCVVFSLGYGVMLFLDRNKMADNSYQKFINVLVLILILVIPNSFMFKVMHWPGGGILFWLSHLLLIISIPFLIVQAVKATDPLKKLDFHNIALVFIVLTGFSLFLMSTGSWSTILKSFNPINKNIITEMKYNESKSTELFAIMENNVNANNTGKEYLDKGTEIKNMGDTLNTFIVNMQKLMMSTTDQKDGNPDSLENLRELSIHGVSDTVASIEKIVGQQLKEKLMAYKELVSQNTNSRGKEIIRLFFNTSDTVQADGKPMTWETAKFDQLPLISVLVTLNQLRSDIRLLEAETMSYLQAMAAISKANAEEKKEGEEKK